RLPAAVPCRPSSLARLAIDRGTIPGSKEVIRVDESSRRGNDRGRSPGLTGRPDPRGPPAPVRLVLHIDGFGRIDSKRWREFGIDVLKFRRSLLTRRLQDTSLLATVGLSQESAGFQHRGAGGGGRCRGAAGRWRRRIHRDAL